MLAAMNEMIYGNGDLQGRKRYLHLIQSTGITDAKSPFDALKASTPANIADREAAIDVVCIKQLMDRTGQYSRWIPGPMNPSDILTKDSGPAADLFRSMVRSGCCTLALEEETMMQRDAEKQRRQREAQERQLKEKARAAERRHPGLAKAQADEEDIAYSESELDGSVWTDGLLYYAI